MHNHIFKHSNTKKIFVVDEPEQGSDPDIAYRIVNTIRDYCRQNSVTLLIISHLEQLKDDTKLDSKIRIIKTLDTSRIVQES